MPVNYAITQEQIAEVVAAVKSEGSQALAAKKLKLARSTISRRLALAKDKKNCPTNADIAKLKAFSTKVKTVKSDKAPVVKSGKSLNEFRSAYDKDIIIPKKIKVGLSLLGSGWEYEVQFAKIAEISLSDLNIYREQFADYVVALRKENKRVWAGTKGVAQAIREILP